MTVRERILALRLLEKEEKKPEYTKQIGVHVYLRAKENQRAGIRRDNNV